MKNSNNRDTRRDMLADIGANSLTRAELERGGRIPNLSDADRANEEKRGSLTFKDPASGGTSKGSGAKIAMDPGSPGVMTVLGGVEATQRRGSQRSSLGRERISAEYWMAEEAKLKAKEQKSGKK